MLTGDGSVAARKATWTGTGPAGGSLVNLPGTSSGRMCQSLQQSTVVRAAGLCWLSEQQADTKAAGLPQPNDLLAPSACSMACTGVHGCCSLLLTTKHSDPINLLCRQCPLTYRSFREVKYQLTAPAAIPANTLAIVGPKRTCLSTAAAAMSSSRSSAAAADAHTPSAGLPFMCRLCSLAVLLLK